MEQALLVDCCGTFSDMELMESTGSGVVKFRGKFQEAESVNKNKRMYPYAVLNDNVKRLTEALRDRRLIGELDHPTDSIVHFTTASHLISKLWWEANTLMGEGEILNTPHGKVLRALLNDGVKVGISSRGVGNGKVNENGILVIGESYKLITFDAVADPSTYAAFQEKVVTDKRRNEDTIDTHPVLDATTSKSTHNYELKNEVACIDTVSKEALIACLGGIVRTQTDQIRRGLSK
jgi:hypothetical protein